MKRILFLQNESIQFPVSRLDQRFAAAGFTVENCWASNDEEPSSIEDLQGAVVYASAHGAYEDIPWIIRQHALISRMAERNIPMLGICFGSQILASALCGRDMVFVREQCEVGYTWIDLAADALHDPLLHGLGERVYMFVWHNDEVRADHPQMQILGKTSLCPNHIWRFRGLPVWGIQGHPELNQEQARAFFCQNRSKLTRDGADVDSLIAHAKEARDAKAMIDNFIQFCAVRCEASLVR